MGIQRNDVFPSKYISSADVEGREIDLVIQDIQMEDVSDGEQKAVLYFTKGKKGMVLNVTNWNVLEDAYGIDSDGWLEKPVVLCVERTTFKGKPTKGLRLHLPKTAPVTRPGGGKPIAKQPEPPEMVEEEQQIDDEIPF